MLSPHFQVFFSLKNHLYFWFHFKKNRKGENEMAKRQLKTFHNYSLWCSNLKAPIPDRTGLPFTNSRGADPLTKNIRLSFFFFFLAIFKAITWWLRWYRVGLQCGRTRFDPWVEKIPWRRKWQPTPVFLPGKSHGRRSLAGYSPWGCKESDTTEAISLFFFFFLAAWLNLFPQSGIDPVPSAVGVES